MTGLDAASILPLVGVMAGIALGFVARRYRFCTLAALERYWYARDTYPLRTLFLASATALVATQAMAHAGIVDLGQSFYLSPAISLPGAVLGGLMFGLGMALVGTCGFGAVLRLGTGSLRSLVVLLTLGLCALATQRGLIAVARLQIVDGTEIGLGLPDQSVGTIVSSWLGLDVAAPVAALIAIAMLAAIFADRGYRRRAVDIFAGASVGLILAFGWLATTWAAERSFEPVQVEAGSFVMPVGEGIMHLTMVTGAVPDYGVGLLVGTLLGAALASWRSREVRWEACDDARELGRHLAGGALMGIGGVFALGCTVGQGISAFSTLALSAPIVMVCIAIGARIGLAWLLEGDALAPLRLLLRSSSHLDHDAT